MPYSACKYAGIQLLKEERMELIVTTGDYVDFIISAGRKIAGEKDYISSLDAATGDGDHWANINMGFEALIAMEEALRGMGFSSLFKKIGMTMMSRIGGSSGILYGGAYQAAGKVLPEEPAITLPQLCDALDAMLTDMMKRGGAKPGFKTMIDALHPAVAAFKESLDKGEEPLALLQKLKQAALLGAEATREMEAVKGRASYQANRGVGHLDPGAVTMAWQIECLSDTLAAKATK